MNKKNIFISVLFSFFILVGSSCGTSQSNTLPETTVLEEKVEVEKTTTASTQEFEEHIKTETTEGIIMTTEEAITIDNSEEGITSFKLSLPVNL